MCYLHNVYQICIVCIFENLIDDEKFKILKILVDIQINLMYK